MSYWRGAFAAWRWSRGVAKRNRLRLQCERERLRARALLARAIEVHPVQTELDEWMVSAMHQALGALNLDALVGHGLPLDVMQGDLSDVYASEVAIFHGGIRSTDILERRSR